eukprot:4895454-Prymnesium_polylepis.1
MCLRPAIDKTAKVASHAFIAAAAAVAAAGVTATIPPTRLTWRAKLTMSGSSTSSGGEKGQTNRSRSSQWWATLLHVELASLSLGPRSRT